MKNKLMNETNLNSLQADVVLNKSRELIVPAGAGSGKTKTLVTKVVHLLKEGANLDNFLVLTFTKKAANEMKIRIKHELRNANMFETLNKIDSSDISTFDSFAYNFVKQNARSINLDSNIELLDQAIFNTYKEEMMKSILLNIISDKSHELYQFLVLFTDKTSLDSLKLDLISLYEKLINIKPINEFSESDLVNNQLNIDFNLVLEKLNHISEEFVLENELMISYLFNEMKVILNELSENDLTKKKFKWKMVSELDKKNILKILEPFTKLEGKGLNYNDLSTIFQDANNYLLIILKILKKYDLMLEDFKAKYNKYEFRDIALFLNLILKTDQLVLERTKEKYKYVFVDEYQDTSLVQSEFLEMLIKDNQKINVLYVGDIKQSIYKFRDAKPDTFIDKLNTVDKIALTTNYRSSSNIIDFVNNIFFNILNDKKRLDIDYKDSHAMLSGSTKYSENDPLADVFLLEIFNENGKEDILEEAFVIGNKIIELKKTNPNLKYNDLAILSRNTKNFKIFRDVFKYLKIPLLVQVDFNLKETYLLKLIANILNLSLNLDNKEAFNRNRFNYISLSRSEIYSLDDFTIFKSLINNNKKILEIDNLIYNKLLSLKKIIFTKSNTEIINFVIEEFDIYKNILKAPKIKEKELQIDYLYNIAKTLSDLDIVACDFVNFIDEISYNEDLNIKIPVLQDSSYDSVIITNIHQSKGLEYHTLFLTELSKKFAKEKLKKVKYLSSEKAILRIPYNDAKSELLKVMNDLKINLESSDTLKEELRLLYVAVTRAEKTLYIIGTPRDYSNLESFNDYLYHAGLLKYIRKNNITKYNSYVKDPNYFLNLSDDKLYYDEKIDLLEEVKFEYEKDYVDKIRSSNKINHLVDDKTYYNLLKGTKLHESFEFNDINETRLGKKLSEIINLKDANIRKELAFSYKKSNTLVNGIIDLVIELEDIVYVIDYKTKNIDESIYRGQLTSYMDYLTLVYPNKNIKMYIYSIVLDKLEEIS